MLGGETSLCNLLLVGPQGSGKSLHAKGMVACHDYEWVATGNACQLITSDDPSEHRQKFLDALALRLDPKDGFTVDNIIHAVRNAYQSGSLVPPKMVLRIFLTMMFGIQENAAVVLDSFPRSISQARDLINHQMSDRSWKLAVVVLGMTADECKTRIRDGQKGRLDNTPDAVGNRLRLYHNETYPMIDFLTHLAKDPHYGHRLKVVSEIPANLHPSRIFWRIEKALGLQHKELPQAIMPPGISPMSLLNVAVREENERILQEV